ncbi:MAG: glycosyltransferase [Clostridia bacterium]|nr:glycosyltransferase [Clostridia bacterium]
MDASEIKISVIMPIYNAADTLRPAMDSVIDQTLGEIEIICVDDGSTDASLSIVREYQKNDPRIRILTEVNAGPGWARNRGIERARGKYIAFLDADDFVEPTLYESLYELAERKSLDIAVSDYDFYYNRTATFRRRIAEPHEDAFLGEGIVSRTEHHDILFQTTSLAAWDKLFRRSFLIEKGLRFPEDIRIFEDAVFVICALSLAERMARRDSILVHHRIHSEQARARAFSKFYQTIPDVYLRIKRFLMQHGVYAPLFNSFVNFTATRCYKIFNMLSPDSKRSFFELLHGGCGEELGWYELAPEYFDSGEVVEFVVSVRTFGYAAYQKHMQSGKRLTRKLQKKESRRLFGLFSGGKKEK